MPLYFDYTLHHSIIPHFTFTSQRNTVHHLYSTRPYQTLPIHHSTSRDVTSPHLDDTEQNQTLCDYTGTLPTRYQITPHQT